MASKKDTASRKLSFSQLLFALVGILIIVSMIASVFVY